MNIFGMNELTRIDAKKAGNFIIGCPKKIGQFDEKIGQFQDRLPEKFGQFEKGRVHLCMVNC